MLAVEAIYFLSRIAPAATGLDVMTYDMQSWISKKERFPKLPSCPNCRPLAGCDFPASGLVETAVVYEDGVAFPPRSLLDPKTHQVHYRASNLDLAKEGKFYPSAEKIALPSLEELPHPDGRLLNLFTEMAGTKETKEAAPLDIARLASLMLLSSGLRPNSGTLLQKEVQRWTPTGGNLGSVELYSLVRNVQGLQSGLYFYQPHQHLLATLHTVGQAEIELLMQQILPDALNPMPAALLIAVGALHRVAHKYGPFAYRISNLDAGVAICQMQLVGRGLGLNIHLQPKWADDAVEKILDLRPQAELVTAVMALFGN
jgi:SagB-type dehydrogenase family enzyme